MITTDAACGKGNVTWQLIPVRCRVSDVYVSVNPGSGNAENIVRRVIAACDETIGKIARPRKVHVVPDVPKTRSGKIMRWMLAAISNGRDVGDANTLANASVLEEIRVMVQGEHAVASTEALSDDIGKFGQNE